MSQPLRIAVIGSRGVPASYGGVERHVEELYARLAAMGCDVTVHARRAYVAPNEDRVEWDRADRPLTSGRYRGMRVVVSSTPRAPGWEALWHSFAASVRAAFGPHDICHYHSLGPAPFAFIPRLFGKKIVVTIHARDWQRAKWGKRAAAYLRFGERTIARRVANVIVVSPELQRVMREEYGRETRYIPNGTNVPAPLYADRIEPWGLARGQYILYFGRIAPEKDVASLIEAYRRVAPAERLVIAGGDEPGMTTLDEARALARSNPNIVFTGYVYSDDLNRLIANSRFAVNPSRLEGLPLAVMEAHALGKHALASDIPAHRTLVTDAGWLFPAGDIDALAQAIKKRLAAGLPERDEALIQRIRNDFNWDSVARETLRLLESL